MQAIERDEERAIRPNEAVNLWHPDLETELAARAEKHIRRADRQRLTGPARDVAMYLAAVNDLRRDLYFDVLWLLCVTFACGLGFGWLGSWYVGPALEPLRELAWWFGQ